MVVRYVDGNLPRVTISIGVASFPQSGDSFQAAMKAADEALYSAKDGGRNKVQSTKQPDAVASSHTLAMQNGLAAGLSRANRNNDAA